MYITAKFTGAKAFCAYYSYQIIYVLNVFFIFSPTFYIYGQVHIHTCRLLQQNVMQCCMQCRSGLANTALATWHYLQYSEETLPMPSRISNKQTAAERPEKATNNDPGSQQAYTGGRTLPFSPQLSPAPLPHNV